MGAYNANVIAAIHMMFGDGAPAGILPVQIPEITTLDDESIAYSDKILYDRGFGLASFGVQASAETETAETGGDQ